MRRLLYGFIIIGLCLPWVIQAKPVLVPYQTLKTSGARDVTPFTIDGAHYLAIPQLAKDIPNTIPNMDGGNADVAVIIFKWINGKFIEYQSLPSHGNEGTAFFTMNGNHYLATSSVHSGPKAPYNPHTYSKLYQWDGKMFYPVQEFFGFASKSWLAFSIGNRHFLALANGVVPLNSQATAANNSVVYEWDGKQFKLFQTLPTKWGYAWDFFTLKGEFYLGLTDHLSESKIYRFNDKRFELFQTFPNTGGRALEHFYIGDDFYIAYANISHPSVIYRWNGKTFVTFQTLEGLGGRNFVFFKHKNNYYLFRVNFIEGNTKNPKTVLASPLYQWQQGSFKTIQTITTYGGVNAAYFEINGEPYLGLANSLNKDIKFRVDSVIYQIQD